MGKAMAQQLLSEGHNVYVAARRVDAMRSLEAAGATVLAMDITQDDQVRAAVVQIERDHGGVDVLINNAGFGSYGAMEDTSLADARYQFEVNLFGLARLTQLLLPSMRRKRSARIINISSMGGRIYTPLGAWYHATKHALEGWSDCLRLELAPMGIDVVVIQPGVILTEFGQGLLEPMLARSGSSAYAPMAQALAKATRTSYEKGDASPPELIARIVSVAIRARRPRTRYAAGKYARPLMFIRRWFGDRVFDRVVLMAIR